MDTYGVVLLCIVGMILIAWLIDRLTHGAIISKIVQWRPVLTAMTALISAVAAVLPSDDFKVVNTILRAVCDGTVTAEELWLMGELKKDERNAYAKNVIAEKLKAAGIIVTAQVEEIIDGVIAVVCMLMPHEAIGDNDVEKLNLELST